MRLRSILFVPGDRPERFDKAIGSGADAVILDLEDAVAPAAKQVAREAVARRLAGGPERCPVFVRVNPVGGPHFQADLVALADLEPAAVVLPKVEGSETVDAYRALVRTLPLAGASLVPIATETPRAVFKLGSLADLQPGLLALTWGAEDLSAAIGASACRDAEGRYTGPYEMVRSLALLAAAAAGTAAIETIYPDINDAGGLAVVARTAARDGFSGMLAIHPSQVTVINAAFEPEPGEVAHARAVVAAFEADDGLGVLRFEGKMLDAPHLAQARRVLARAGADPHPAKV